MIGTLSAAWPFLTGPRVQDSWVDLLEVVPGIPRGATHLQTDFESGTTDGWGQTWFGGPAAVTNTNVSTVSRSGTRSLRIVFPTSAAGAGAQRAVTGLTIGRTYTTEVWAYIPTGGPNLRFGDPFGQTQTVGADEDIRDEWQLLSFTWVASTTTVYLVARSSAATTAGQLVYIDDFIVYEGYPGSDRQERLIGSLDGVEAFTVEQNANAIIRGGMNLSYKEGADGPLDWGMVRFRPWVRANDYIWPLGVYLPASPTLQHNQFGRSWEVPGLDKTSLLDADLITETYTAPRLTVVTNHVRDLIGSVGEVSGITANPLGLVRTPMHWPPGTSKLRIINDLLETINYFSLWADRRGQLRAEPYVRPQSRAVSATFASGDAAIHSPSWTREQDIAGVPNRVVLQTTGDDTTPGLIAVADNTDPTSPYSIPRRGGRVVAQPYTVEATDQATLDALALRYLQGASNPSATLQVSHAAVPLDLNQVVRFVDEGVDTHAVVERYSVSMKPGSLMTGVWREVTNHD